MVNKVKQNKIRSEVMSLAEALHEEGRVEGRQEGMLIGRIQALERLLGKKPRPESEFSSLSAKSLEKEYLDLESQMQKYFRANRAPAVVE